MSPGWCWCASGDPNAALAGAGVDFSGSRFVFRRMELERVKSASTTGHSNPITPFEPLMWKDRAKPDGAMDAFGGLGSWYLVHFGRSVSWSSGTKIGGQMHSAGCRSVLLVLHLPFGIGFGRPSKEYHNRNPKKTPKKELLLSVLTDGLVDVDVDVDDIKINARIGIWGRVTIWI